MNNQKTLLDEAESKKEKAEPTELAEVKEAAIAPKTLDADLAEKLIANGDLSTLAAEQRTAYYLYMCDRSGLDPAGRPFEYIKFRDGKIMLYPKKGCAEQLRRIHGISVVELSTQKVNGEYIVNCIVKDRLGRTEADVGVVAATDSNSLMKAVTKAKRRATLAICGLGALEEAHPSEFEDEQIEEIVCKSAILLEDEAETKKLFRDVVNSKIEDAGLPDDIWPAIITQTMRLAGTTRFDDAARWLQDKGSIVLDKDDNGNVVKATIKEVNNENRQG